MAHYETAKMRSCAQDIQKELDSFYYPAKEEIDNIVTNMGGYFKDEVATNFTNKYNNEAKPSAESLRNLMLQYVSLMNQTADQYDKVINVGLQGIGG